MSEEQNKIEVFGSSLFTKQAQGNPVMHTSIPATSLDQLAELSMAAISRCDPKEATFSEL